MQCEAEFRLLQKLEDDDIDMSLFKSDSANSTSSSGKLGGDEDDAKMGRQSNGDVATLSLWDPTKLLDAKRDKVRSWRSIDWSNVYFFPKDVLLCIFF